MAKITGGRAMKPLNQPALRFAGFADAWEQRKLGEIVTKQIKGKAQLENLQHGSVEYLDASRLNGGNVLLSNGIQNVLQDDILILWDGSKAGTVYTGFTGVLGSTLKAYQVGSNSQFVYQFLKYNQDNIYANYRTPNIPHVQKDFLDVFEISLPLDQEQAVIGNFFRQLDEAIAAHQRKLEKIKELKNSLLHKMFPKDGETVPELRLSGFTDAWEQRKLGELGSVAMNKRIFKEQTTTIGDVPFYKIGTFGGIADAYISRELFEEYRNKYPYPEKGDILLSASGSIGKAVEYQGNDEYFQDSNIVWLKHNNLNNSFLKYFYSIVKWEGIEGSTIKRLYNDNILKTKILLPSLQEQTAIGNFFRQLDTVIEAYQQKSNQLHTLKTALLGKMFV